MKALLTLYFLCVLGVSSLDILAAESNNIDRLQDKDLAKADKIVVLKAAKPEDDATAAFKANDYRFLDLTGFEAVAGIDRWNGELKKKYGTRIIGESLSIWLDDEDKTFKQLRRKYASRYNKALLKHLGVTFTPEPADDQLTEQDRIKSLIDQLAISDEPAKDGPIFEPSINTPTMDLRVKAYDASVELEKFGIAAFPQLLEHLDDNRQSVHFSAVVRARVGLACRSILRWQLHSLPKGYPHSMGRYDAEEKYHLRPAYITIYHDEDVKEWLKEREGKSLTELQIEVVAWILDGERKIGVKDDDDKERIIGNLEGHLKALKAKQAADAKNK